MRFLKSLRHALDGLGYLFRTQRNARVQLVCAALVLMLGRVLEIRPWEWVALVLHIALVLALEAVNTALEALCDEVTLAHRPRIRAAKDVAAGAVLLAVTAAAFTGAFVFLPKLAARFF